MSGNGTPGPPENTGDQPMLVTDRDDEADVELVALLDGELLC